MFADDSAWLVFFPSSLRNRSFSGILHPEHRATLIFFSTFPFHRFIPALICVSPLARTAFGWLFEPLVRFTHNFSSWLPMASALDWTPPPHQKTKLPLHSRGFILSTWEKHLDPPSQSICKSPFICIFFKRAPFFIPVSFQFSSSLHGASFAPWWTAKSFFRRQSVEGPPSTIPRWAFSKTYLTLRIMTFSDPPLWTSFFLFLRVYSLTGVPVVFRVLVDGPKKKHTPHPTPPPPNPNNRELQRFSSNAPSLLFYLPPATDSFPFPPPSLLAPHLVVPKS